MVAQVLITQNRMLLFHGYKLKPPRPLTVGAVRAVMGKSRQARSGFACFHGNKTSWEWLVAVETLVLKTLDRGQSLSEYKRNKDEVRVVIASYLPAEGIRTLRKSGNGSNNLALR